MRKSSLVAFAVLGGLALPGVSPALAGDLNPSFALETAETLPANVRNPRFIDLFASITQRFADDGGRESLGTPLNKVVRWGDVLNEQEDRAKRALVRGVLRTQGLDEATGIPGYTTGEVNTFADVKVAALAWGITDRFTLAGVLPVVHVDVSASTGFVANDSTADYARFVSGLSRAQTPLTAQEATQQFNDAVNRKLLRLGYEPIPSHETISGVGDFQLIGKYRIHDDGVNGVALKGTLVFPTGTAPDPDKALDIPTGDGRLGAGLTAIYDRRLPFDLRWDSYAAYTAWLPHHLVKRIPTSVEDPLSADKEDMLERTRSQVAFGTGVDHLFSSTGIVVGGGYSFQYLTRADYAAGTTFGEDRYYLLGDQQPLESLHSLVASAGFSTIDWYQHKRFVYPLQVNVSYSHPFAGRNAPAGDLVAGELIVFF